MIIKHLDILSITDIFSSTSNTDIDVSRAHRLPPPPPPGKRAESCHQTFADERVRGGRGAHVAAALGDGEELGVVLRPDGNLSGPPTIT